MTESTDPSAQPRLGKAGTFAMLAIISAFPPISTDLYIPALPQLVEELSTTDTLVNFTVAVFFITYAVALLFWGPLSEKYGRRAMLLSGISVYIAASVGCALAPSIELLILARIVQALGGGASTVIGVAIVKDLYAGRERERVMAMVMSLVTLGPLLAPILGGLLIKYFSWRANFVALVVFGCVALSFTLLFRETLAPEDRHEGSLFKVWARLITVLKNPGFRALLFPFTLIQAVIFAYIGSASYIYIRGFGLSEQSFSYFFSFNAAFALMGPMLYVRLSKQLSRQAIISAGYIFMMLGGLLLFSFGSSSPYVFAACAVPGTMAVSVIKVPTTNLMLEQMDSDSGSQSALINFFTVSLGTLGMAATSYSPGHQIAAMSGVNLSVGLLCGAGWLLARRSAAVKLG